MKVLAIMPSVYDTSPGQRFRLEQWEPLLREHDIEVTWTPFEDNDLHTVMGKPGHFLSKVAGIMRGGFRRLDDSLKMRKYDVVYILREAALLGPAIFERIWNVTGARIVF